VKEPNYDRDYRRQPPETTNYIEQLAGGLKRRFLREAAPRTSDREGDVVERSRDIYYDTDGIHERQHEKIRVCSECAGALSIASTSNRGQHILAVHIPTGACKACRDTGHRWYEQGEKGPFSHVYLQDRVHRVYRQAGGQG
ncbi:MAG: histone deacetylase, partial [Thermodesulfobacteriota bacterium]